MMDKQPNSRMCFICGLQNPVGLKMSIYSDPETRQSTSTVTIPDHFRGYPGVVHGGIIAAMLDEVAGRALLIDGGDDYLMVTLKLEVKYRRPTPTLTPLTIVGKVTQPGTTRAAVHGEIRLPDGTVTAEADIVLARTPGSVRDLWDDEREDWKVYPDNEGAAPS